MTLKDNKFCLRQHKSKKTKKVCINCFPNSFSISKSKCWDCLIDSKRFFPCFSPCYAPGTWNLLVHFFFPGSGSYRDAKCNTCNTELKKSKPKKSTGWISTPWDGIFLHNANSFVQTNSFGQVESW